MKINQQESIKLYLKVKSPKIIDEPYYEIDKEKNIFTLKSREKLKTTENLINLKLDEIFNEENTNNDIYNKACSNVIKECLTGCSFCFINHGETISDKLYTLMGDIDNNSKNNEKGIFQNLFFELINNIGKNKKECSNINLQFSFTCVNNSKVIDLNNFLKKEININITKIMQATKLIQNDKSLINSLKKIPLTPSNHLHILSFITKIISEFKNNALEFFSNSYFSIIIFIEKKIKNETIPQSSITFILLNGSEKLNIIDNIKITKNNMIENSDIKKRAITASKNAISTQNNYNSIVYLIKQNKVFNLKKRKNKEEEKLTKEETKELETMEGRYISSLTALLYKICFDYKIENIKYYIFCNIFPNMGYYKSVKDTILFLFDLSKILNKNIKDKLNIEKKQNILETNFLLDLETKINQQEATISALSEICQSKNKKIFFLENEYDSQIKKLKKIFGFEGDLRVLLSGEESLEAEKARNIREAGNKIYKLNTQIKKLEKQLKYSKDEIDKYKSKEEIMAEDSNMIKYLEGINRMKNDKLNEMKIKSFIGNKINSLEKELKNKNIIINQLNQDLENKNNIIQNFSKYCPKKSTKEEEEKKINNEKKIKTEKKEEILNNKINDNIVKKKDIKEIEIEKLKDEYEKKLKDEKDFWKGQLENKNNEIKDMQKIYKKYIEKEKKYEKVILQYELEIKKLNEEILNHKRGLNSKDKEIMNLNDILMDIINNYNSYFIHKSQPKLNFVSLKNKIDEFSAYITEKEKEINQLNFPILHILLEKNNKLSNNYKTKIDRKIKLNVKFKKENSCSNFSYNRTKENSKSDNNDIKNNFNKPPYLNAEIKLTKEYLEQMKLDDLIEYCLTLNQRVNAVDEYVKRFQEINLENEENKKQIEYLKLRLKKVISESDKIHEINNNNRIVMNSQNRTIEKFQKDKLNELCINDIEKLNDLGFTYSPKRSLHFNKSQANLQTYSDIYNKNRNKGRKYNIFLKNKTENKGINFIKGKKIKELKIPCEYFGIDSDYQTLDTNNYDDLMLLKSKESKYNNTNKNLFKNELSASYNNFYSQN